MTEPLIFVLIYQKHSKALIPTKENKTDNHLLTRIHDKWHDLSKFDHPGGPVALGLAKGRDATALFESHHYFIERQKLLQILAKYEVPPEVSTTLSILDDRDENDNQSPYDWSGIDKGGFACEIRGLLVDYFSSLAKHRGTSVVEETKATPERWLIICTFLGLFFVSLPAFVRGSWFFSRNSHPGPDSDRKLLA